MGAGESRGAVEGSAGSIAYRKMGTGPALVLINGYAATKDDWDPTLLSELAGRSTLICPDNRGMGESEPGTQEATIEAMAEDAVAVMDALSRPTAAIVGWSMGGFVAQQLAASAPDRVEALILLSTDPGGDLADRREATVHQKLTDHTGTPDEQARRLLELLFPPVVAKTIYEQFGDIVAAARAQLSADALSAQEAAMELWYEGSAEDRLAAIQAPALIAAGNEDTVIPRRNAELLAAQLDGSWLARFEGGGHAFMAQEPARVAALINAFLARP